MIISSILNLLKKLFKENINKNTAKIFNMRFESITENKYTPNKIPHIDILKNSQNIFLSKDLLSVKIIQKEPIDATYKPRVIISLVSIKNESAVKDNTNPPNPKIDSIKNAIKKIKLTIKICSIFLLYQNLIKF